MVHTLHDFFSFPWGQGLHDAQWLFTMPWGNGLHTTHRFFCFPCGHRFRFIVRVRRSTKHTVLLPTPRATKCDAHAKRQSEKVVAFSVGPDLLTRQAVFGAFRSSLNRDTLKHPAALSCDCTKPRVTRTHARTRDTMTSAMRQAENTRLLVSSDDASTASPTSGWSRVAMGAGIGLGAIAAVAALATRPETFSDITLGYGISLPSDAHAQGLSTEAIRPVAPGQPAGAHDELSTEDAMRLNPSLGKSHAHASSTDDDSDRDQQFLVPSVVVDKIAEKLAKSKTSHR